MPLTAAVSPGWGKLYEVVAPLPWCRAPATDSWLPMPLSTESPRITLVCAYNICAGHRLRREDWSADKNREVFGHCANNHGHQYRLELYLAGGIDPESGMLINGYAVDAIVRPFLTEYFDHKFLNDDVAFFREHQPSAEWIAYWVYHELKKKFPAPVALVKVRLAETPELAVEYHESNGAR